ncbi:MAG: L,D-transpeptidase family protein, partial [Candidatus Omnitrophica bacterium]|nr:L,D-transpeptidase family protein [Candidatus Omnitrophota bacterium]
KNSLLSGALMTMLTGFGISLDVNENIAFAQEGDVDNQLDYASTLPAVLRDNITLYLIEKDTSLEELSKKFNMTEEFLKELNNIDIDQIKAGRVIKVIHLKYEIVINRKERKLFLTTEEGELIKECKVGVGRPGRRTPLGRFKVLKRFWRKPYWKNPDTKRIYLYGHKKYPYGKLGIYIQISRALGMHSTSWLVTVGQARSKGCIRLSDEDAIDLYKFVTVGTLVTILKTQSASSPIQIQRRMLLKFLKWSIDKADKYFYSKHYKRAIFFYRLAIFIKFRLFSKVYFNLAYAYERENKFNKADNTFKEFILMLKEPHTIEDYINLGYANFALRDYEKAEAHLLDALKKAEKKLTPKEEAYIRGLLGRVYSRLSQRAKEEGKKEKQKEFFDLAKREFNEAIKLDEKSSYAHYYLGRLYIIEDKFFDAIRELKEFIKMSQKDSIEDIDMLVSAYYNLGLIEEYFWNKSRNREQNIWEVARNFASAIEIKPSIKRELNGKFKDNLEAKEEILKFVELWLKMPESERKLIIERQKNSSSSSPIDNPDEQWPGEPEIRSRKHQTLRAAMRTKNLIDEVKVQIARIVDPFSEERFSYNYLFGIYSVPFGEGYVIGLNEDITSISLTPRGNLYYPVHRAYEAIGLWENIQKAQDFTELLNSLIRWRPLSVLEWDDLFKRLKEGKAKLTNVTTKFDLRNKARELLEAFIAQLIIKEFTTLPQEYLPGIKKLLEQYGVEPKISHQLCTLLGLLFENLLKRDIADDELRQLDWTHPLGYPGWWKKALTEAKLSSGQAKLERLVAFMLKEKLALSITSSPIYSFASMKEKRKLKTQGLGLKGI